MMSIPTISEVARERTAPLDQLPLTVAAHLPVADVLTALGSTSSGLTSADAAAHLRRGGPNLIRTSRISALGVFGRQFRNPLLLLLLTAAAVSAATGDPTDAAIIAAIVFLSVGLGFFNEFRSEQAVAALHDRIRHVAVAWRDGTPRTVDVAALVPGDVVSLNLGEIIPADMRLMGVSRLACDEAVLTGESLPVDKTATPLGMAADENGLASCVFMGTLVQRCAGSGVVVATGSATAFGRIAAGLATSPRPTAFQAGLSDFSKLLVVIAGVLTTAVFLINALLARPILEALLFSLAIAIGITPQLLPAIVTVSLAAGARTLARHRVVVKRLVTIEDLGNMQVLFTDKTGTLTQGALRFAASLDIRDAPAAHPLELGLVCNEAVASDQGAVGGNQLDEAVWAVADAKARAAAAAYRRVGLLPFDHERQMVSVLADTVDRGRLLLVTKGAPEAVLARCVDVPSTAAATPQRLFADGARVIAVATKSAAGLDQVSPTDECELRLVGFLSFQDPPKPGAGPALAQLHELGITVKVVTGDNGIVAANVCRALGLEPSGVRTGSQLAALGDDELGRLIQRTTVFARISPEQKARIITVARHGGADIGFLGDGVNDAVALHAADIGISVDSAVDVAKDAADIVLLEKDLGMLAEGIREGRRIFANTLKYVLMASSSNFGNMFSAAGASLVLSFLPMLPSQVLLNNLLYDVGQLAIPTDRADPEAVTRPAAWDIAFVRRFMAVFGPISSCFDFLTFFILLHLLHAGPREFRTGWFVESLATQTMVVFLIRTRRVPFFTSRPSIAMVLTPLAAALTGMLLPFTPVAGWLGFVPLPISFFLALVALALTYLGVVELGQRWFYARLTPQPIRRAWPAGCTTDRSVARRASRFIRLLSAKRGRRRKGART